MTDRTLDIVVSGMIAATPYQGGATWAVLQYLLGFQRLGHNVIFVEAIPPEAVCPAGAPLAMSDNAEYLSTVMSRFGLDGTWALMTAGPTDAVGIPLDELEEMTRRTDLLVNIAGTISDEIPMDDIPIRVYLDLDPVFTQIWASTYGIDMGFEGHNRFITVGQAIGGPECPVPTGGIEWLPTLQPVVLDHWPVAGEATSGALTTVANWRSYGPVEHDGRFYGQKVHSLRAFMDLPKLTSEPCELALSIHPDEASDLAALHDAEWNLVDPAAVASTPDRYRNYIGRSMAELGIAKHGYVAARSGWFSDRSACYLASGRPVIAQDTGFGDYLPIGRGLLAFETAEDLLSNLADLRERYDDHRHAAREIAIEHFDSDKVLGRFLRIVGAG